MRVFSVSGGVSRREKNATRCQEKRKLNLVEQFKVAGSVRLCAGVVRSARVNQGFRKKK